MGKLKPLQVYREEITEAEKEEESKEEDLSMYSESVQKRIRESEKSKLPEAAALGPGRKDERAEEAATPSGTRYPVTSRPTENRVPKGVPTTLEGALQFEGEGKSVHEVLGILVEAQEKEAKAILGRTNLVNYEDVIAVGDIFHLARHGIGGRFEEPQPFIGEWALDILHSLVSVGGKSRGEFVNAWASAEKERARAQAEAERNQKRLGS